MSISNTIIVNHTFTCTMFNQLLVQHFGKFFTYKKNSCCFLPYMYWHLIVNSTEWVSKFLMVLFSVSNLGGTDSNPHWTIIVIGKGRLMHMVNFKYTHNVHTIMYTLGQTLVILPARFTCFILFYLSFNLYRIKDQINEQLLNITEPKISQFRCFVRCSGLVLF